MELSAPFIIEQNNTNYVNVKEEECVPYSSVLGTEDGKIEPDLNDFDMKYSRELVSVINIDQSESEAKVQSEKDGNILGNADKAKYSISYQEDLPKKTEGTNKTVAGAENGSDYEIIDLDIIDKALIIKTEASNEYSTSACISNFDENEESIIVQCPQCNHQIKREKNLGRNTIEIVKIKCDRCNCEISCEPNFNGQILSHTYSKMFNCIHCDFKTVQKYDLCEHFVTIHNELKLKCTHCSYQTKRKGHLNRHIARHQVREKDGKLKCKKCNFQTHFEYSLFEHSKLHKKTQRKKTQRN